MSRVRACFRCKTFVRINENDPKNLQLLNMFDRMHSGHPLQVVNINELNSSYSETFDLKREGS